MVLSTYVSAVTGHCFSTRLYSPTKAAMFTSALVSSGYQSWEHIMDLEGVLHSGEAVPVDGPDAATITPAANPSAMNPASQFFDLFISSVTAAACTWYYPQLFLLEMDDDRERERKQYPSTNDFTVDSANAAAAAGGEPQSTTTAAKNAQQQFTGSPKTKGTDTSANADSANPDPKSDFQRWRGRRSTEAEQWRRFRQQFEYMNHSESPNKGSGDEFKIIDEAARKQADPLGYFALLELSAGASTSEIQTAFRKQALRCHPDMHQNEQDKKVAHEKFKELVRIYNILRDPQRRQRYVETGKA